MTELEKRKELFDRFGVLTYQLKDCRGIVQDDLSYINKENVEEWIEQMRKLAKNLNGLYTDTLTLLAKKIV